MPFMTVFFRNCSWFVTRPGLCSGGCVGGCTMPLTGCMSSSSRGGGAPPPPPLVVLDGAASPLDTPSDDIFERRVSQRQKRCCGLCELTTEPTRCPPSGLGDAREVLKD